MMLNAVSTTLGYKAGQVPIDFPPFVLQGLLDMFPMVQTLPNDCIIYIQIPVGDRLDSGVVTLVVWAHQILDLTVLVRPRKDKDRSRPDIRFGSNLEQVFIEEIATDDEPTIILLDARKEPLLTIKPKPDGEYALIGSVRRTPPKGWRNTLLADYLPEQISDVQSLALIEEMQIVISAFAFVTAQSLVKHDICEYPAEIVTTMGDKSAYNVEEQRLLHASRFLFDKSDIGLQEIRAFAKQYSIKTLDERLPMPPSLDAASRKYQPPERRQSMAEDIWNQLCGHARRLGVFVIALAHVTDLNECDDLMFAGLAFDEMFHHIQAQQLEEWNGKDALPVPDDAWLQAIAIPLLGPRTPVWKLPWRQVCLVSDGGWSAWIPTLGELNPAHTGAGSLRLGRGSPCRNEIWKSGIWDSEHGHLSFHTDMEKVDLCGQSTSLQCAVNVLMDSPYCGEGEDVFVVCARRRLHKSIATQKPLIRVGYKKLQKYLWWAQLTKRCPHAGQVWRIQSLLWVVRLSQDLETTLMMQANGF